MEGFMSYPYDLDLNFDNIRIQVTGGADPE